MLLVEVVGRDVWFGVQVIFDENNWICILTVSVNLVVSRFVLL